MVGRGLRRIVGGISVFAMAAGFAATVGVGSAAAASESVSWSDGNSKFKRTISDTTLSVGQEVEVSTRFERDWALEVITRVDDYRPSCLELVSSNKSGASDKGTYTRVTGSWTVRPYFDPTSQTFTFKYRVTEDCARDTQLTTGMAYDGSLGSGSYKTKGPNFTVAKNTTTTSLASVPGPVVAGVPVTLSATVTGGASGDPVDFYDGGTKVGSGQLNTSGVATFEWTPQEAGTRSLQAKFSSTSKAKSSQSGTQDVQVSAPVSTGMVVTVPGTAITGVPVDLSAQLSPVEAQGTVQFFDGGAPIGDPVEVVNAAASVSHTFAAAGEYGISAEFTAAPGFTNASAATQTVTVSDVVTSLEVQAPGEAITGEPVELSAQVSPTEAPGTVQFSVNGAQVGGPVEVVGGAAVLSHVFAAAGDASVSAEFTGALGFTNASSAPVTVAVSDVVTSLEVQAPGAAITGEPVDLTAQVAPTDAAGTVQFSVNGAPVGGPVEVVGGAAVLSHAFAAAGDASVAAEFTGAPGFANASGAPVTVAVSDPDVVTSLEVQAPGTVTTLESVDLTAQVSPVEAAGTVQFFDGDAPIGDPIEVVGGAASLPHAFAAAGEYSISAVFTGAPGFTDASTAGQTVTVTDLTTSLEIQQSGAATTGEPVALLAQVSPVPSGGTVQLKVDGVDVGTPVEVDDSGRATLLHTFDAAGSYAVSAEYSGTPGFARSQAAVTVTVADPADEVSSVVITSSPAATAGVPFTLKARVLPEDATGTVQFFDGDAEIGDPVEVVDGVAELVYTFDSSGPHEIHVVYSGGPGVEGSTSQVQVLDVTESGDADTGSLGSLFGL
ncbi:Ig-like domain-containing protein [Rhodococcus spongiicola]|uniref:Ig-like domain repeat protein n=1 Tax=Rhodococcus spongiicola TaxID=2487352 RepID=A0A3S3E065_9NOCA|nr:Ig-like domain-containing protein [Rhodococcus spongiicola]RVW02245.1 Ig-like domain repeat protein [Rhodococcus spongiicola]